MGQGVSFVPFVYGPGQGPSTLPEDRTSSLNNSGQQSQATSLQNEPQGDASTLPEEHTPSLNSGGQSSKAASFQNEAEEIPSKPLEEVAPILDKGKQRATFVQDDDAKTRVSGCSTSSLVDQFGVRMGHR
ncbi:hypothetical protein CC2G_011318 [Coprinopsis cinerea AmutBmut pab1-1]|nr:hypothetical protein CC2G_011318 [Coprinopsis cinerea AmutBmut pab1-1]